ncbi:MAG: hypothetical protein MUO76_03190 [Anaerolineaceae bacterium]|nr:hypothetical protein [Anaerolineaceae bacterium]
MSIRMDWEWGLVKAHTQVRIYRVGLFFRSLYIAETVGTDLCVCPDGLEMGIGKDALFVFVLEPGSLFQQVNFTWNSHNFLTTSE